MQRPQLSMHRAPLPEHLTKGSFSLRASDKAGVSRTRTGAKDLATVSRGIRIHLDSEAAGAAALRAYTQLDDASVLSFGSAARIVQAALPPWLEDDWRVHVARRRGFSVPRRVNVVGHLLTLLPDEVVEYDGARLTSPARTWLDRRHPGLRGVRTARAALELIRVGADSQPETKMRLSIVRAGLPDPVLNYMVLLGAYGNPVLWPDAAYPEHRRTARSSQQSPRGVGEQGLAREMTLGRSYGRRDCPDVPSGW